MVVQAREHLVCLGRSPTFPAAVAWLERRLCPAFRLEVAEQVVMAVNNQVVCPPHVRYARWNGTIVELVVDEVLDEPDVVRPDEDGRYSLGARTWPWQLWSASLYRNDTAIAGQRDSALPVVASRRWW